jgi:hypothetical protein
LKGVALLGLAGAGVAGAVFFAVRGLGVVGLLDCAGACLVASYLCERKARAIQRKHLSDLEAPAVDPNVDAEKA